MNDKYFIDTNIFIYSFDQRDKQKQQRAQQIIDQALKTNKGIISYQVVQEFLNVAIRGFSVAISANDCLVYLDQVLQPLWKIYPASEIYKEALLVQMETQFSFYDALIVACAIHGGCNILYSEDLQSGQKIAGLKIENPFIG